MIKAVSNFQEIKNEYLTMDQKYEIDNVWFVVNIEDVSQETLTKYLEGIGYTIISIREAWERNFIVVKVNPYQKILKFYMPFIFLGNALFLTSSVNMTCERGMKLTDKSMILTLFPEANMFFNEIQT